MENGMIIKCLECGEVATVENINERTSFTLQHMHGRKLPYGQKKVDPWFTMAKQ